MMTPCDNDTSRALCSFWTCMAFTPLSAKSKTHCRSTVTHIPGTRYMISWSAWIGRRTVNLRWKTTSYVRGPPNHALYNQSANRNSVKYNTSHSKVWRYFRPLALIWGYVCLFGTTVTQKRGYFFFPAPLGERDTKWLLGLCCAKPRHPSPSHTSSRRYSSSIPTPSVWVCHPFSHGPFLLPEGLSWSMNLDTRFEMSTYVVTESIWSTRFFTTPLRAINPPFLPWSRQWPSSQWSCCPLRTPRRLFLWFQLYFITVTDPFGLSALHTLLWSILKVESWLLL